MNYPLHLTFHVVIYRQQYPTKTFRRHFEINANSEHDGRRCVLETAIEDGFFVKRIEVKEVIRNPDT